MTLTTRQYRLLQELMDSDDYVVISDLAGHLNLSTRTVQRELSAVSDFLRENGGTIEKKAGKGVRFLGSEELKDRLKERFSTPSGLRPMYSQAERVQAILTMLLQENEPRKIAAFSGRLDVSEATIGNDLNLCQPWLLQSGIKLQRKQGAGVFLSATEWQRRQALVRLYHEHENSLADADPASRYHLDSLPLIEGLFDPVIIRKLEKLITAIPELCDVYASDKSRRSLVVHLYTIYARVLQGAGLTKRSREANISDATEELAGMIIRAMEEMFSIKIPAGENEYLGLLLKCTHGISMLHSPEAERRAKSIAERMLRMAESATGVMLNTSGVFFDALVKHLVPTIYRLKMGMEIRNPMAEEIKSHYAPYYELAETCSVVIKDELGLEVPEAEFCYLALHLGVAIEDIRSLRSRRCHAIVCCPSGMVTAQLLALRIGREFGDIIVDDVISTANINYDSLRERGIDIIISTVPLADCPIPCAHVSSFLKEEEKTVVWELLKSCRGQNNNIFSALNEGQFLEELQEGKSVVDAILSILENFFLETDKALDNIDKVIEFAGRKAGANPECAALIARDLRRREKLGSITVADEGTLLLHCCTDGVSEPWFGVIRTAPFSYANLERRLEPETILVMLAPKQASKALLGVLVAISQAVADNYWFNDNLRRGDKSSCYLSLERILKKYYSESGKL